MLLYFYLHCNTNCSSMCDSGLPPLTACRPKAQLLARTSFLQGKCAVPCLWLSTALPAGRVIPSWGVIHGVQAFKIRQRHIGWQQWQCPAEGCHARPSQHECSQTAFGGVSDSPPQSMPPAQILANLGTCCIRPLACLA